MTTHATRLVRASEPALVTVPNVELLEVGEDWETSTGVFSWTHEDLVAAIESQDDPSVRTPVIKLGHVDPRFDGEPGLGRVEALRLTNNEQTLVGDLVGVPLWLAKVMASAYPRRSIEGQFAYTSRTGNSWDFILSAVALLGSAYPAINTLEDVQALWGADPPPLYPVEDVQEVAALGGGYFRARRVEAMPKWRRGGTAAAAASVQASMSLDDVRRDYYDSLNSSQMWWWIRQVLVDPLELVVDDDEGGLYKVAVTVNGDNIEFGNPQPVKVEYVAAAGQLVAASYRGPTDTGRPVRAASEPTHDAPTPTQDAPTQDTEEGDVKLTAEALQKLGLPADADDDAINAAILSLNAETGDGGGTGDTPAEPGTPPAPAEPPGTPPEQPPAPGEEGAGTTEAPAAPQVPEGMALIDQATLADLQDGVAAAREMREERVQAERGRVLDDAVKAGKFPPARRDHYAKLMAADPEGTKALIASLATGVVPLEERGAAGGDDPQAEASAYPESWSGAVKAAHRSVGSRLKVVGD